MKGCLQGRVAELKKRQFFDGEIRLKSSKNCKKASLATAPANYQTEELIVLLKRLSESNSEALVENKENTVVDKTTYFERNSRVIKLANEFMAFQVNDSEGVQDTIDKAQAEYKLVYLKKYQLD